MENISVFAASFAGCIVLLGTPSDRAASRKGFLRAVLIGTAWRFLNNRREYHAAPIALVNDML